jgi:Pyrimidine dimer DNA glycosylase
MNIFFLDKSPKLAAQYHCDKHVVKMIIETAQLLYSAHWMLNSPLPANAYKLAHKNHPCAIWVRQSVINYLWLCSLGLHLCAEYKHRYGEHKTHKTEAHIQWLFHNRPQNIPWCDMTTPVQAMPDEFKNEDPIIAYKTYYIESKLKQRNIVKYTRREPPEFILATINGRGDIQVPYKGSSKTKT